MRRVLLLLAVAASLFVLAKGQRRLNSFTKRLMRQVLLLKKDVADLEKQVVDLNETVLSSCICIDDSVINSTGIVNETILVTEIANKTIPVTEETPAYVPFEVLEITRDHIGLGKVTYTVKYFVHPTIPVQNLFSYWNRRNKDHSYVKLNGSNPERREPRAANTTTASAVTTVEEETFVLFVFGAADLWYVLRLTNSDSQNMTVTDISLPELRVSPEEVLYSIGENASFQIHMSENLDFDGDIGSVLTRVGTHEFVNFNNLGSSSIVHLNNSEKNGGVTKTTNVTLDMSNVPSSGVIAFKAEAVELNNSLLDSIDVYRRFVIRPNNQSRPFDDDFFAFDTRNMGGDFDGNFVQHCNFGAMCIVRCPVAVGSNKTKMAIWYWDRILKYRKKEVISNQNIEDPFYISELFGKIPEGVQEVFCDASRSEPYKTITSPPIKIEWQSPPKVTSGYVRLKGDGAYSKTLRVVCSARGIPVPSMAIKVECSVGSLYFEGDQLENKVLRSDFIKVSKDVIIPWEYLHQTVTASCIAFNGAGNDMKEMRPVYIY